MSWSKTFHSVSEKYHALFIAQNRGQKKKEKKAVEKVFPLPYLCSVTESLVSSGEDSFKRQIH